MSQEDVWTIFQNPPNEYRMAPFWFWNHVMKREELDAQLADFADHGIGGGFMHARHGRLTPYMSEAWLKVTRECAQDADTRGMYVWLYDEDNWPSGTCGNALKDLQHGIKVLGVVDEDVIHGPVHYEGHVELPAGAGVSLYMVLAIPLEEVPDPWMTCDLAQTLGFQGAGYAPGCITGHPEEIIDITPADGEVDYVWDAPEGTWLVATLAWAINPNYLNTLNRKACRDFVKSTHEKYAKELEKVPGLVPGVVPGIFTDEPSFDYTLKGNFMGRAITWDEDAEAQLRRRVKDLEPWQAIPYAFYEGGAITTRLRCMVWESITQAYADAFHGEIYRFCDLHGWITTGHLNGEGGFPGSITNQGDVFTIFEKMHFTGIDQLTTGLRLEGVRFPYAGTNPYRGAMQDNMFSGKLASSAAHLLNKPRVLSECFGTSGWMLTLEGQKRLVDWAIITGVDYFVPHDFSYSIEGVRKRDHPPSFNHQPYYPLYRTIADYTARLAAVFSVNHGRTLARIAVLYPSKSFWRSLGPRESPTSTLLSQDFSHLTDLLFRNQMEFDFINEELLQTATLSPVGKLKRGSGEYDVVILPPLLAIADKTLAALERFVSAGGRVIAVGALPLGTTDKGDDPDVQSKLETLFGVTPAQTWDAVLNQRTIFKDVTVQAGNGVEGGEWVFLGESKRPLYATSFFATFRKVLNEHCPRDLLVRCPTNDDPDATPDYVAIQHRLHEGVHYIFIANPTISESYQNAEITINAKGRLEMWDVLTGTRQSAKGAIINDEQTRVWLNFPPYASYLLVLYPAQAPTDEADLDLSHADVRGESEKEISLGDNWKIRSDRPNVVVFDDNITFRNLFKSNSAGDPLNGIFPSGGTHTALQWEIAFDCETPTLMKPVQVVLDGLLGDQAFGEREDFIHYLNHMQVIVNGKSLGIAFPKKTTYIDRFWIAADISKHLVEGRNIVIVESQSSMAERFHTVYEPIRLTGNFEVDQSGTVPLLRQPNPQQPHLIESNGWVDFGFPRYWGAITYEQEVDFGRDYANYQVVLEIPAMDNAVEVLLDDEVVEVLPWRKNTLAYEVNLNQYLKLDVAKLGIKVYGTAGSVMEHNIVPAGLTEAPVLKYFPKF